MVRRLGGGMDDLPRVLSDRPARGVCLRGRRRAPPRPPQAGAASRRAARGKSRRAADRSRRILEARRHRESCGVDPRPARGDARPAVLPAVDDEPAAAGVVRARPSGTQSISAVRAVERSVAARARRLSVRDRAVDRHADAGIRVVGGLCGLRAAVRGDRVANGTVRCYAGTGSATAAKRRWRRGCATCVDAQRAVGLPRGGRQRAAAVGDEPHHAEHRGRAALVDRAADAVPADVHPVLRQQPLVSARPAAAGGGRGPRRDGVVPRRPAPQSSASGSSSRACSATASSRGCVLRPAT